MSDYISREEALKKLHTSFLGLDYGKYSMTTNLFKSIPSADVKENIHGKWTVDEIDLKMYCSNCRKYSGGHENFCPYCGCQMDK